MSAIVKNEKIQKKAAVLSALAGSALLLVGAGCEVATDANVNAAAGANVNAGATNSSSTPSDTMKSSYKDGTYAVVGHYVSPAGPETIDVSITLKDGIVTEAAVERNATNKKSIFMQDAFISGYKAQVVGKNIDEVNLVGSISGSSLTLKGFNEAVVQVKAQAAVK